jgi:hypothetical protein
MAVSSLYDRLGSKYMPRSGGSFNWLGDTENKVKCQAYMLTFKVPYFQPICDASLLYTRKGEKHPAMKCMMMTNWFH